jgi:site-specific DNA recombinase
MERDIDESLLCLLNNFVEMICDVSKKIDNIVSTSKIEYNIETKKLQLVEVEKGIQKYKKLIDEVVKDYQCDFISQEDYEEFKRKYLYEINKLNMEKENLKRTRINSYNLDWLNKFRKLQKFDSIDRNIVDIFIENIFVDNNKNLDVKFRFNDQYKIAIEYLKNQKNML